MLRTASSAVYCMVRCEAHVAFRTGCCVELVRHAVCFFACRVLRVRWVFLCVVRDCVYCGAFRAVCRAACPIGCYDTDARRVARYGNAVRRMLRCMTHFACRMLRVTCYATRHTWSKCCVA